MNKKTQKDSDLSIVIGKIEELLGREIDSLPDTLESVSPDKKLDFISRTLPVVVKYRESHSSGWDI